MPFRRLLPALFLMSFAIQSHAGDDIAFTQETLENGLKVIYAPLHQAPVVHVRVLYHVGSRDERPDRQGFAHMFEHMMFRGSAHVKPEEHMKLIGMVGGISNAFTSFDQTVYVNTIPSNHLGHGPLSRGRPDEQLQGVGGDLQDRAEGGRRGMADAAEQAVRVDVRGLPQERLRRPQLPLDPDREDGAPRRPPR